MTPDRDRFNSHNDASDRIPDPLLPAHGTRLLTCPHCKATFEPPENVQMVQCPMCYSAMPITNPKYTRSG